jgi:hypothetical protein
MIIRLIALSNSFCETFHFQGCAMLYVSERMQSLMKPFVVSHGSGSGFLSDFIWTGMID